MFFKKNTNKKKSSRKKISDDRMCSTCEYSEYSKGTRVKDCIYICKKDPNCPVNMGNILHAQHKFYKKRKNNTKKEVAGSDL